MTRKVAIIGGGIGGLSAAHELVKRAVHSVEFEVHVYERRSRLGGKAAGQMQPHAAAGVLPGEHGFRFFPHFYRHITETLREIPSPAGGTVHDRLVSATQAGLAVGGNLITIPRPLRAGSLKDMVRQRFSELGVSPADMTSYAAMLLLFITSCHERRVAEYDPISWREFLRIDEDLYSPKFTELILTASSNLSAMRADQSSAMSIGQASIQMMWDFEPDHEHHFDAVFDGPTNEVWLDPWRTHLEQQGVVFHTESVCTELHLEPEVSQEAERQLLGVTIEHGGRAERVEADYYVLAVPLEHASPLVAGDLAAHDEALRNLRRLATRRSGANMFGCQFFLKRDVPFCNGHVDYPFTDWALTSVSQAQFWAEPLSRYGVEGLRGVLSVIVSEWEKPSQRSGRAVADCTDADQILDDVWAQLTGVLPVGMLELDDVLARRVDSAVTFAPTARHSQPLLIHPRGQYELRPPAQIRVANLVLAASYVRTHMDLASMESANEAARRAVRVLLHREGVGKRGWPVVEPLSEGRLFEYAKAADRTLFRLGLPHLMDIPGDAVDSARALLGQVLGTAPIAKSVAFATHDSPELALCQDCDRMLAEGPRMDWRNLDERDLDAWEALLTG